MSDDPNIENFIDNVVLFPAKEPPKHNCVMCGWHMPHKFQHSIKLPAGYVVTMSNEFKLEVSSHFECPDCGNMIVVGSVFDEKLLTKKGK